MVEEITWKKMKEDSRYLVSDTGEIYSLISGKILRKQLNGNKYFMVSISNRMKQVSRLVANNFLDNYNNKPQVAHIDGNCQNNHVSNLRWSTQSENERDKINHGRTSRSLTKEDVLNIVNEYLETGETGLICKKYGIDKGNFKRLLNKEAYSEIERPYVQLKRKDLLPKDLGFKILEGLQSEMTPMQIQRVLNLSKTSYYRHLNNYIKSKEGK